jgi:hypothetical protein
VRGGGVKGGAAGVQRSCRLCSISSRRAPGPFPHAYNPHPPRPLPRFVECEPDVLRVALRPLQPSGAGDHFVILGSDGLWDVLSDEDAVDCGKRALQVRGGLGRGRACVSFPQLACTMESRALMPACCRLWQPTAPLLLQPMAAGCQGRERRQRGQEGGRRAAGGELAPRHRGQRQRCRYAAQVVKSVSLSIAIKPWWSRAIWWWQAWGGGRRGGCQGFAFASPKPYPV